MSESVSTTQGLTRRELLKRGAALGGALAWATPAVQMIGMQPAMAQVPSDTCFCIKLSACNDEASWTELGVGGGNCTDELSDAFPTDCDAHFQPDPEDFLVGSCVGLEDDQVCIEFDNGSATLFFPAYCTLEYVAEKAGSDTCLNRTPGASDGGTFNLDGSYTFPVRTSQPGCSHIEVCFRC